MEHKTPEQFCQEYLGIPITKLIHAQIIAIMQAYYNYALEQAAEKAKIICIDHKGKRKEGEIYYGEGFDVEVSKQSILDLKINK